MCLSGYELWEREVINNVISMLQCPNGDAQGIVEAQELELSQCWARDLAPDETAQLVLQQGFAIH